ncbi:oxidoreductase [Xanthomonas vesicatoria ATCC 35937]|uniref:Short-chain alcohol dehydrogenase n=1 Tax=Xanthomonas vesicatoria ATCC 35937 TaxID=925775 RepID=F0BFC3_9XANT|nr:SDR family oxidoreductase [Xanthomonas vesicatoria]APP74197.1 oxidoreductase [Xanthomonas vesicatoria ATCC 35937]EGD08824.1 short-chain alcohol dehydrogenase [Xanthomonas vesicatoria ATCC 35937]KTF32784.1 oxidoreductase [Xanthomonas vesicatoria]MCC8595360.1 SDR family oxidoreductase [Xanthomonas vesicatoria]MCC8604144.1 SDR family oxidoreductase [Xanthomonas vesicatoria]
MSNGIQGKVVVITGASSGIGEATARHLAAQGAKVVLGARRAERLNSLVAEIVGAGGDAVAIATDVTRAEDVTRLVDTAAEKFGRVDVLINNAGVMPLSNLESLKVAEWDQMINVNIKGVLHGIAAALPHMKRQKSGQIITTASVAGHLVFPASSVYSGTKFAVRAICEGLRQEVKAYNIRTTILSPGAVKTELLDHISDEAVKSANSDYVAQVGIPADSYARMATFAIGQPDDVDVNEIIFRPTAQTL